MRLLVLFIIGTISSCAVFASLLMRSPRVALLAVGFIIIAIAVLVKKVLSDPLQNLTAEAVRISNGDLGHRIALDRRDEIGTLATAVNQMADKAQSLQQDIEEATRLSEEIKDQKEFYDAIFNNAVSGMMVLNKNGILLRINQAGSEILQLMPEKIIGRNIVAIHPEVKEMLALNPSVSREVHIQITGGEIRPIGFTNSHLFDKDGRERGIIIVFRDITEIKKLQNEIRKKQHFEAIGKVISGVAHEIRNPLFAIQSIAQILERESELPQHHGLIQAMLKETLRMRKLVEELLLYSRPSKLTVVDVNIELFMEELEGYVRSKYPDVVMSITIPPESFIKADRDRLIQVFQNLVDNALGAGCKKIEVSSAKRDDVLLISLRDDGTGIKKTDMERIFDPFFTTKKDGTGLGLPICRKIIEDHGGTLEVQSNEGEGTTVTVTFTL